MSDFTIILVALEGTFPGWPAADQPSAVQSLLVLVGVPLLVSAIIGVLVFAGYLARRGRGDQVHLAEPVWVGGQTDEVESAAAARELTAGDADVEKTGGASARW